MNCPGLRETFVRRGQDGAIHILESGRGESVPLLMIHGGGTDSAAISWCDLLGRDLGRRMVAPDLPGFGATTLPPTGSPGQMADLMAEVAGELGLDRAVVCGVSMGGDVALNLALRHPSLVAGLMLIAPGGLLGAMSHPAAQAAAWAVLQLPEPLLMRAAGFANRFSNQALKALVSAPDAVPPDAIAEFHRQARTRGSGRGYLHYNRATIGPRHMRNDLLPLVSRITCPTTFFHGGEDRLVPLDCSQKAANAMPDARLIVLPRAGHWAQLEAPQRFAEELQNLLRVIDR